MNNTPVAKADIDIENEPEFDEEWELALIEIQQGRLFDLYGPEHSEAIFRNWPPRAVKALGIHRRDDGDGGAA